MILTEKQQQGLDIAVARYQLGAPWTCISGYAGSGKSTLIKFIIAALGLTNNEVCYVAYTGKAAQVLRQKGCPNAITAHKLLYKAKPMPNGTYIFEEKPILDEDYKLLVVDEISMLPMEMWLALLKHRIPVIACGDPFQLPPVDQDADNHVLDDPHIFLDEIMRQAQDSEIIRLSMHIREGQPLNTFKASENQVIICKPQDVVSGMYEWADQILCATNERRHSVNTIMRDLKGFGPEPEVGDKIISLRNQWEFFSNSNEPAPLTNGTIGYITKSLKKNLYIPQWISASPIPVLYTGMEDENEDLFEAIPIDYTSLTTGQKFLTGQQEFKMRKNSRCPNPPFEFAYAYGITVHKSQGSEWKKVLVFEERFPFDKTEHARWLYTAVTRASEKLVVVSK